MASVPESVINEIRERIDIVELVGRYVPLKRFGTNHKACCPFHQEKTPSFHVNAQRQFYYCFGCGANGDIFSFLMAYEGRSFVDAVGSLAEELGVEIEISEEERAEISHREQNKEKLYQANQLAQNFFLKNLQGSEGGFARTYLERRGIQPEIAQKFGLGYATESWGELTAHLRELGFSLDAAEEAGLIKASDKNTLESDPEKRKHLYDRFRHRLMFPIFLPSGRLAGFGGRALRDKDGAKYLNSPESMIFHKGSLLYGLDHAHHAIRKSRRAILVEGYTDVLCMHQYGFEEAVATLGTALTEEHLKLLGRYADRLVLLFDADQAGIKAVARGLGHVLPAGMSADVLALPEGEDPDSFLRKNGREAFAKMLEEKTEPAFDFWMNHLIQQADSDPARLHSASKDLLELLQKIKDPILQSLYLKKMTDALGVEESQLRRQLMRVVPPLSATRRSKRDEETDVSAPKVEKLPPVSSHEQVVVTTLIKLVIDHRDLLHMIAEAEIDSLLAEGLWMQIWERLLQDAYEDAESPVLIKGVLESLQSDTTLEKFMAEHLVKKPPYPSPEEILEDSVHKLQILKLKKEAKELQKAIQIAFQEEDNDKVQTLTREKFSVVRKIKQIEINAIRISTPDFSIRENI